MRIDKLMIAITFFVAVLLSAMPLPEWVLWFRPAWVPLVLAYWVIVVPHRVNLGTAWLLGILLDVLNNTLLGEHALALVIVAYLAGKFYRQIRVFPIWQQAASVTLLILLHQMLLFWIQGIVGQSINTLLFWLPTLTSLLLWPLLSTVLGDVRRHFQIY